VNDRREGPAGDGDLPPDPWAGLAEPSPIPPPTGQRGWDHQLTGDGPADRGGHQPPTAGWHPSGSVPGPELPARRSSIWHHPVVWALITVLAVVALVGAALDRPAPSTPEPSPGSLDAAPASPAAPVEDLPAI
jgi:hypothetical protein